MDIATWLNISNGSRLESIIMAPLIEAAHDEQILSLIEYTFIWILNCNISMWNLF